MLERRTFIALVGGTILTWPSSARAGPQDSVATVGVVMGLANDAEAHARAEAFEQGLRKEGWSVGKNLRIEYRFSGGDVGRMQTFAKEFSILKPDCIVGHSTPVVAALLQANRTIPIVFVNVTDPVGSGFVEHGTTQRQCHGVHHFGRHYHRQISLDTYTAGAAPQPSRHRVQPGFRASLGIILSASVRLRGKGILGRTGRRTGPQHCRDRKRHYGPGRKARRRPYCHARQFHGASS